MHLKSALKCAQGGVGRRGERAQSMDTRADSDASEGGPLPLGAALGAAARRGAPRVSQSQISSMFPDGSCTNSCVTSTPPSTRTWRA
jgi:hypothetical protein